MATKASKVEFFELRNKIENKMNLEDLETSENMLLGRIMEF
jgi:hypothetical protein